MKYRGKLTLLLPGSWCRCFLKNRVKAVVVCLEVRHRNVVDAGREGPSESSDHSSTGSHIHTVHQLRMATRSPLVPTGSQRPLIIEVKGSFL